MSHGHMGPALEYASLPHHLHGLELRHDGAEVLAGRRCRLPRRPQRPQRSRRACAASSHAVRPGVRTLELSPPRDEGFLEEKQTCPEGRHRRLAPRVRCYKATLGWMTPLSAARYFPHVFTRVNIVYTTQNLVWTKKICTGGDALRGIFGAIHYIGTATFEYHGYDWHPCTDWRLHRHHANTLHPASPKRYKPTREPRPGCPKYGILAYSLQNIQGIPPMSSIFNPL
jgi:hypothetical protein